MELMKDKQVLNLPMHRTLMLLLFFLFLHFLAWWRGLLHDLKFRRVTQAFDKTIKIKKSKNANSRLSIFSHRHSYRGIWPSLA